MAEVRARGGGVRELPGVSTAGLFARMGEGTPCPVVGPSATWTLAYLELEHAEVVGGEKVKGLVKVKVLMRMRDDIVLRDVKVREVEGGCFLDHHDEYITAVLILLCLVLYCEMARGMGCVESEDEGGIYIKGGFVCM